MNERTDRLLSQYSSVSGLPLEDLKRLWANTPQRLRGLRRQLMVKAVRHAKEKHGKAVHGTTVGDIS